MLPVPKTFALSKSLIVIWHERFALNLNFGVLCKSTFAGWWVTWRVYKKSSAHLSGRSLRWRSSQISSLCLHCVSKMYSTCVIQRHGIVFLFRLFLTEGILTVLSNIFFLFRSDSDHEGGSSQENHQWDGLSPWWTSVSCQNWCLGRFMWRLFDQRPLDPDSRSLQEEVRKRHLWFVIAALRRDHCLWCAG